jgi:hypothetical protein
MKRNGSRAFPISAPAGRRFQWRRLLYLAVTVSLLLVARRGYTQDSRPTEYEVEAAYLSNFGRFVDWPVKPAGADPFSVCVLGQDPFGPLLDNALRGEAIGGVPMAAKRLSAADDASACRILFISSAKEPQLPAILTSLGTSNVLTVSDMPSFTRRGGMIQFVLDGNRVRFEINLNAAQHAGLSLSSQLLKVAVAIRRSP